jgi:hypothetical protein
LESALIVTKIFAGIVSQIILNGYDVKIRKLLRLSVSKSSLINGMVFSGSSGLDGFWHVNRQRLSMIKKLL